MATMNGTVPGDAGVQMGVGLDVCGQGLQERENQEHEVGSRGRNHHTGAGERCVLVAVARHLDGQAPPRDDQHGDDGFHRHIDAQVVREARDAARVLDVDPEERGHAGEQDEAHGHEEVPAAKAAAKPLGEEAVRDGAKDHVPDAVDDAAGDCDGAGKCRVEALCEHEAGEDDAGDDDVPAAAHEVHHAVADAALDVD